MLRQLTKAYKTLKTWILIHFIYGVDELPNLNIGSFDPNYQLSADTPSKPRYRSPPIFLYTANTPYIQVCNNKKNMLVYKFFH